MAFTVVQTSARSLYRSWLARRYSSQFDAIGKNFLVKAPCNLKSAGELKAGDNFILDSWRGKPITIDVGREASLSIGSDVYINFGTSILCRMEIRIGDRCLIGPEVMILDEDGHPLSWRGRHDYWPKGRQGRIGAPVIIQEGVWICARATVLKGVTVGAHSVVAAGAVVTRSVPPRTVVAGVPAVVVRALPE